MLSLSIFIRIIIIVTVVIAATDAIVFYRIKKKGIQYITWKIVLAVIIITIIPIVINLWYHFIFNSG